MKKVKGFSEIITNEKLKNWDNLYGGSMSLTSFDKECMVKEIIALREFTKKLILEREGLYGKIQGAISEILFDSIR